MSNVSLDIPIKIQTLIRQNMTDLDKEKNVKNIFTAAFLLFLALVEALTLRFPVSNPAGYSITFTYTKTSKNLHLRFVPMIQKNVLMAICMKLPFNKKAIKGFDYAKFQVHLFT